MCVCYGGNSPPASPQASPQASPRASPGGKRFYRGGNRRQQYAIARAQMKKQGGGNFQPPKKGKRVDDMPFFPELRGASYSLELKKWTFPLYLHDHIQEVLEKTKKPHITVKPIPRPVLSTLLPSIFPPQSTKRGRKKSKSAPETPIQRPPSPREEAMDLSLLPPHFLPKLLPFQLQGIAYGIKRKARMLLGDEMGLGKTVQGIALAACYPQSWPLLIICPSSVRMSWRDEFVTWVPSIRCPDDVNVIFSSKDSFPSCYQVHIISYDLVEKMKDDLHNLNPQFVIADESHYIKSMEAKRTKAVLPLLKGAKHALLLSGTPSLSRPSELYPQLQALGAEIFPNFKDYAFRYCNAFSTPYGLDHSGSSHLKELSTILRHTVMLRRLKSDVLKDLPSKRRHKAILSIPPDITEAMKAGFGKLRSADNNRALPVTNLSDSLTLQHSNQRRKILMQLYQDSALGKIDSVKDYLRDFIPKQSEKGKKVILFAHHQDVMDELQSALSSMGKQFIRIDGRTSPKDRKPLCDRFQTNSNVEVALLSITAAGVGITLTAASTVIFVELYWTPGALLQAEDRAHRIGQSENVEIIYLIGKGTLDETLWNILMKKVTVVGNTLGGGADDSSMEFTPQTLKTLIDALGKQGEGEGEAEDPIVSDAPGGRKRVERRIDSYCQVISSETSSPGSERIPETDDEDFVDEMGEEVVMGGEEIHGPQSNENDLCVPPKRRFAHRGRKVLFGSDDEETGVWHVQNKEVDSADLSYADGSGIYGEGDGRFDCEDGESLDGDSGEESEYSQNEEDRNFIDDEIDEIEVSESEDNIGLVESPMSTKSVDRISETDEEDSPVTENSRRHRSRQKVIVPEWDYVEIIEKGSPSEGKKGRVSPLIQKSSPVLVDGSPPRSPFSQVIPETQYPVPQTQPSPSSREGTPVSREGTPVSSEMFFPSSPVELLSMNLPSSEERHSGWKGKGKEKEMEEKEEKEEGEKDETEFKSPFFSKLSQKNSFGFLDQLLGKRSDQTKPLVLSSPSPKDPIIDVDFESGEGRARRETREEEGGFLIHDAMEYTQDDYALFGSSLKTPGSNR